MPTSKDILEAQRFNRNRLITAFTSGTPGGREVDTPSPVRPLIVGAVVAIIVCVIGIALRSFAAKPDLTDANYKLVDVKDTGARYLSVNGVLHPISNVTTAKLLAGDSGLTIVSASASSLKDTPRGAQIGLPGVPDDVPASADLASTWLSCDLPTSYHTWIAQDLPADNFPLQPATAALVQAVGSEDKYFIDAKTHKKYLIDASVSRLGDWVLSFQNRTAYPIIVEPEWLDLFPSGTRLKPWSYSDIPNAGEPARNLPGPLKNENLTIGTVVEQINSNGEVLNSYLVINDSDLAVFNSTAAKLYQDAPKVEQYPTEMFKDVAPVQADFIGEDWPTVEDFANPEWKDDKLDAASRTVHEGQYCSAIWPVHHEGTTCYPGILRRRIGLCDGWSDDVAHGHGGRRFRGRRGADGGRWRCWCLRFHFGYGVPTFAWRCSRHLDQGPRVDIG